MEKHAGEFFFAIDNGHWIVLQAQHRVMSNRQFAHIDMHGPVDRKILWREPLKSGDAPTTVKLPSHRSLKFPAEVESDTRAVRPLPRSIFIQQFNQLLQFSPRRHE